MATYLIRHTTPRGAEGTCYGQTDLPLGPNFAEEAEKVRGLCPERIGKIYVSPLNRCIRLARYLWPVKTILTIDALKEMHFGEWEGKPWSDIDRGVLDAWMGDFVHAAVPGGESYTLLQQRVVAWWDEEIQTIVRNPDDIIIVTHAGVIRSLLCHCTGIPLAASFERIPVPFGAVYRLEEENGSWETRLL